MTIVSMTVDEWYWKIPKLLESNIYIKRSDVK